MAKLIFKPSGPGHHFRALVGSGYVDCDSPGPVEVTDEQAEYLLENYPSNFSQLQVKKAVVMPESNKAMEPPDKNKGKRKGGDG